MGTGYCMNMQILGRDCSKIEGNEQRVGLFGCNRFFFSFKKILAYFFTTCQLFNEYFEDTYALADNYRQQLSSESLIRKNNLSNYKGKSKICKEERKPKIDELTEIVSYLE